MPAKIVVNAYRGGSRVSLLGSSGKELLTSGVFKEPRAKGATVRALKGLLGDVVVEDHTVVTAATAKAKTLAAPAVATKTVRVEAGPATPAPKRGATKKAAKPAARRAAGTKKTTGK